MNQREKIAAYAAGYPLPEEEEMKSNEQLVKELMDDVGFEGLMIGVTKCLLSDGLNMNLAEVKKLLKIIIDGITESQVAES